VIELKRMKDPRDIIYRPVLTEKAIHLKDTNNEYTFYVARDANKIEIKKAIEELFKVHVTKVTTMQVKGKRRRLGRLPEGKTSTRKKAICKLKEGERIDIFEGV